RSTRFAGGSCASSSSTRPGWRGCSMASIAELLDAVEAAPEGPDVAAFFDYDGTVIDGFSASAYYGHRIRHADIGPLELARTLLAQARGITTDEDFENFLDMALMAWKGRPEEELAELGESLFKHETAGR